MWTDHKMLDAGRTGQELMHWVVPVIIVIYNGNLSADPQTCHSGVQ